MLSHLLFLLLGFGAILAGSELFTNAVEWTGEKLGIAEAAVGSLLAAVGTALPETFIPLVALIMSRGHPGPHSQVGIGAIVGAPLMLSTVALAVMGIAALAFRKRRKQIALRVIRDDARRDLGFFLPVFLTVLLAGSLVDLGTLSRRLLAALLLVIYVLYAARMLKIQRSSEAEVEHGLYFEHAFRGRPDAPRLWVTLLQVLAGTVAILLGAQEFVNQIINFSAHAGITPGVLSLILSPLATELPEKFNSVVWIRRNKDHLALANITGAMVFQSCIPVTLGLLFTPWHLGAPELLAGAIAIGCSAILYLNLQDSEVRLPTLALGGAAYAAFIAGLAYLGAL